MSDKSWNGTEFVVTTEDETEVLEGDWPTAEQFDAAHRHGTEYAVEERRNGAEQGQESPLSGEWADGMTPRKVAYNVGYFMAEHEEDYESAENELADAWERGYFDVWAHCTTPLTYGDLFS